MLLLVVILLGAGCSHTAATHLPAVTSPVAAAREASPAPPPVVRQQGPYFLALEANLARSVARTQNADDLRQLLRSFLITYASKAGVELQERDLGEHAGLYVVDPEDMKLLVIIDLVAEAEPVLPRKEDLRAQAFVRDGRLVLLEGSPSPSQVNEVLAAHQRAPASHDSLQLTVEVDRFLAGIHYDPEQLVDDALRLSGFARKDLEALPRFEGYVRKQRSLLKGLQHVQTLRAAVAFEEDVARLNLSVEPVPGSPLARFAQSHGARPLRSAFRFQHSSPSVVVFSDLEATAANELNQAQLEDVLIELPWSEPEKAFLKAATSRISALRSGTISLSAWTNPDGRSSSLLFIESPQGEELIRNLLDVSALVTARQLATEAETALERSSLPYVQPTPPEHVEQLLHQTAKVPLGATRIAHVSFEGTHVWHLQQSRYELDDELFEEKLLELAICAVPEGVLIAGGPNSLHEIEGWIAGSRAERAGRGVQQALHLEKGPWMGLLLNVGVDRAAIAQLAPLHPLLKTLNVGDMLAHAVAETGSKLPELVADEDLEPGVISLVGWSERGTLQFQLSAPMTAGALSQALVDSSQGTSDGELR